MPEKTEFRPFTKRELAINVYNQFLDKLVRLEIDLPYHELRLAGAKPETSEKKQYRDKVKMTKQAISEGKTRLQMCAEYIKGLK